MRVYDHAGRFSVGCSKVADIDTLVSYHVNMCLEDVEIEIVSGTFTIASPFDTNTC